MPETDTITTADTTVLSPLTEAEKATLNALLERAAVDGSPAVQIGDPYEALVNLSVPQRGSRDRATDLVLRGETVYLTEAEARRFNRTDARAGRQIPVVRKLNGPDGSREALPRVLPRHVSGKLFRPVQPSPGSDSPRPDPEGSSRIQVMEEGAAPETSGGVDVDPSELANQFTAAAAPDAVDLPPRNAPRRGTPNNGRR